MTSYTWKSTANGEFSSPGNWVQGAVPGPGDTAVVDTSALSPFSSTKVATQLLDETLSVASLTYRYTWNSQGVANIASAFLTDSTIGPGTTLAVTSTSPNPSARALDLATGFDLAFFGAVSNAGTIAIGSPGDGNGTKVTSDLYNSLAPDANHNYNAGAFSNSGLISVGYGSLYNLNSRISGVQFANTGTIAVSGGATFILGDPNIGVGVFTGSQGFSNEGVVSVLGAAGTVTASDGNVVFLVGAAPDLVVAGAGNVTLAGAASWGSNSFFAGFGADLISGGSGNDSFVAGTGQATLSGGGANVFSFVNGRAGGSDVVTDFRAGVDHLSLQGYAVGAALSRATVSGGATALTLGDGTRVTLQGVTRLGVADFV